MSRFNCCDYDGEGPPPEFWQQAVRNAIRGRKGQAILRELREALLALPQPRLISGSVAYEGEVCAIGALAASRLTKGPIKLTEWFVSTGSREIGSLEELEERFGNWIDDEIGTVELGMSMGLTRALAWGISYENDEGTWNTETPEQKYQRVLAWVDRELLPVTK